MSPERIDPGRTDYTRAHDAEGGRRPHARLHRARRWRSTRVCVDTLVPVSSPDAAELVEAAREHLPQRQHRARQRDGDAVRPDGDRHVGGDRRRRHQAVRVHARSTPAPAWAATASRSTPSTSPGARASSTSTRSSSSWPARSTRRCRTSAPSKVARARTSGRKPCHGSRVLVLGVAYKPDVGDMRESPAAEADRAAAASRRRHQLPRPARARRSPRGPRPAVVPLDDGRGRGLRHRRAS